MTIHNDGDGVLAISTTQYPDRFSGQPMGIQPGGTQTVVFVFSPLEAKTYFGDIIIESNGGTATKSI